MKGRQQFLSCETFHFFQRYSDFWMVSVLENLVLEKSLGFGKFGLIKKFWFWKILSGEKKSQFRSKFWSRHSVVAN